MASRKLHTESSESSRKYKNPTLPVVRNKCAGVLGRYMVEQIGVRLGPSSFLGSVYLAEESYNISPTKKSYII